MFVLRKFALCALVLTAACQSVNEPLDRGGTVLFEIEYVNYAWVPTWKGYYIDSGGSVFSYDRSEVRANGVPEKTEFTHDELMEKLSVKRAHVRELSMGEVLAKFDLIAPAANGPLSNPVMRCADAGTVTYRAYRFDFSKQKFVPVLLYQQGDRAQANLSAEGKQLFQWLDSLKLMNRFPGCEP
jgi:hypothetical protein